MTLIVLGPSLIFLPTQPDNYYFILMLCYVSFIVSNNNNNKLQFKLRLHLLIWDVLYIWIYSLWV